MNENKGVHRNNSSTFKNDYQAESTQVFWSTEELKLLKTIKKREAQKEYEFTIQ